MTQTILNTNDFDHILDNYAGREIIHIPVTRGTANISGGEDLIDGTAVLIKAYIMRTGQNWDYVKAGFLEKGDAVALCKYADAVKKDDKLYAYGVALTITAIDGDATTITITSASHGLSVGSEVVIQNTTGYDGLYTVATTPNANTFTIADTNHDLDAETSGIATKDFTKFRIKEAFEVPGVFDSTGGATEIVYIGCNLFLIDDG